jgi:hypothetical protein
MPNKFAKLASLSLLIAVTFSSLGGCAMDDATDDADITEGPHKPHGVLVNKFDDLDLEADDVRRVPEHPMLDGDEDLGVDAAELLADLIRDAELRRATDAPVASVTGQR